MLLPGQSSFVEFSDRARMKRMSLPHGLGLVMEFSKRPRVKSLLLPGQSLVVEFSDRERMKSMLLPWTKFGRGIL